MVSLEVFIATAPTPVVEAAEILAISLAVPTQTLLKSISILLGLDPDRSQRVLEDLQSWPFVSSISGEHMVASEIQPLLAERLFSSNPRRFVLAHEFYAKFEEELEVFQESDDDAWSARARLAYYLTPLDLDAAVLEFADLFDHAPEFDRTFSRLWLGELVIRQQQVFGTTSRIVAFYRGFQSYVAGRYRQAHSLFETVTQDGESDVYQAIALHLGALSRVPNTSAVALQELERSVTLSQDLMLDVNELMARNSLVWGKIRGSNDTNRHSPELRAASDLARLNLDRALELQASRSIMSWVKRSAAVSYWLYEVGTDHRFRDQDTLAPLVPGVILQLQEARDMATAIGDLITVLRAVNDAATVYLDVGDSVRAFEFLQYASEFSISMEIEDREVLGLLQMTASRLVKHNRDPGLASSVEDLVSSFDLRRS